MKVFIIVALLFAVSYAALYFCANKNLRQHIDPLFAASVIVPLAAGHLLPNAAVFFGLVVVTFLASVRSRVDIVCKFILLSLVLPNIGYNISFGGADLGTLNTVRLLSLCALAAMAWKRDGVRMPGALAPADLLVAILFLVGWIGETRFPSLSIFLRAGWQTALIWLPYLVLRFGIRTRDELRALVACFVAAAVILSVWALYEMWHHWALFDTINHALTTRGYVTKNILVRGGFLRPSATMNGPLMLAGCLSMAAVAALVSREYFRSTLTWAGCCGLILLGCIACQSRGNAAGVAIGITLVLALRGKWAFAAIVSGGGAVAAATLLLLASSSSPVGALFNLGKSYTHGGDVYTDYRGLLLTRGLQEGMRHKWFGASMDENVAHLADITQGQHIVDVVNTYLKLFLTSGFAGLVPILALMVLALIQLIRAGTGRRPDAQTLRAFLVAATIGVYLQLAFMAFIDRVPLLLVLALAGGRLYVLTRGAEVREGQPQAAAGKPRLVESADGPTGGALVLGEAIAPAARQPQPVMG